MAKKLSTDEFIKRARKIHGDKYDYSKVDYKGVHNKVCIICPIHGEFWQTPYDHLDGCGCPKCGKILLIKKKTYTQEQFIEKAKKIHGDKYDYSKTEYKYNKTPVCIICHEKDENGIEHGEFWQTPNDHLQGKGCPKCNKAHKTTTEEFIECAKKVHGDKYDYSKVEYKNSVSKVCIICPKHGEFWLTPNAHLMGHGCKECDNERKRQIKYTTDEIIEKFKKIHGDKYDYSKFNYKGIFEKSTIICPKHGEFQMAAHEHLKGCGCPNCNQSSLEFEIEQELHKRNIIFEKQKTFDWLKYKSKQRLDFYLPDYNVAIECQGVQHFRPIFHFGGEETFKGTKERDLNKKLLCEKNGVKLLYFSKENIFINNGDIIYTEINDLFNEFLKK